MKFLADAHISVEMVAMIRALGHDCLDTSAIPPRMQDIDVLRMAADDARVVITSDKDFGELVFVHGIPCPGVVLIRVSLAHETDRVSHVRSVWSTVLSRLPGSFLTIAMSGSAPGRSHKRKPRINTMGKNSIQIDFLILKNNAVNPAGIQNDLIRLPPDHSKTSPLLASWLLSLHVRRMPDCGVCRGRFRSPDGNPRHTWRDHRQRTRGR